MLLHNASRRNTDEQPSDESTSALQRATSLAVEDARRKFETLSEREHSVLQRVAEGYSVVDIARLLGTTPKSVNTSMARLARKLGVTHRTDYVRVALQLGLIGNASSQQGATTTGSRR